MKLFDSRSRYASLPSETLTASDGTIVNYVSRRFLPLAESLPILQKVVVKAGDRIDLVTSRTLGDSLQFWRICDANDAMDPLDLTAAPGTVLIVPVPQG
jgi:hypothetical protein